MALQVWGCGVSSGWLVLQQRTWNGNGMCCSESVEQNRSPPVGRIQRVWGGGGGREEGRREWGEVYPAGNPTKIGSSGLVWDEKWQF